MDFVLDASFTLHWCFEDEATAACESLLTELQNQKYAAFVPDIWSYELLNGLGKGITRGRVELQKAFLLWQEIRALPIHIINTPVDEKLLELALKHDLAVYDASYLSVAMTRNLSIATGDGKLQTAAQSVGLGIIPP
ncbi:MAG: type II toxin-antitoxin system VapC family toxin [Bryobacteraceae bacterium]